VPRRRLAAGAVVSTTARFVVTVTLTWAIFICWVALALAEPTRVELRKPLPVPSTAGICPSGQRNVRRVRAESEHAPARRPEGRLPRLPAWVPQQHGRVLRRDPGALKSRPRGGSTLRSAVCLNANQQRRSHR
jgi:hypothetical protein